MRQTPEQVQDKIAQAHTLVQSGTSINKACKEVGVSYTAYWRAKKLKTLRKATRKPRQKLVISDFKPIAQVPAQAFLIYGSPANLAEFVKAYQ